MKKHLLVVGIIFLFVCMGFQPAFANDVSIGIVEPQSKDGTFMKTYGGTGDQYGKFVQQTTDGGYIIVGDKDALVWLFKTDNVGNKVWDKTFTGEGSDRHFSFCVQQTTDDGYIISGTRYFSQTNEGGAWLIKTNSAGNKQWDKTFGGWKNDEARYVQKTNDGGYIITGTINDRLFLIKTNVNGNLEWDKTYGGTRGYCVQQTSDGGYIVTGERDFQICLIKTNSTGNKEWEKIFSSSYTDVGYSVQQTTDGGYIIVGELDGDIWLMKTDSAGNKIWEKTFGGVSRGECVQQTSDGGYIIIGWKWSLVVGTEFLLIKTDSSGNKEWDNSYGINKDNFGHCGHQTSDDGYIIIGEAESFGTGFDILLIKTNRVGEIRSKAVTDNILLLRLLERFPLLWRVVSRLNLN